MMHVIYVGNSEQKAVEGLPFIRDMVTFVDPKLRELVEDTRDFVVIDIKKDRKAEEKKEKESKGKYVSAYKRKDGPNIHVELPIPLRFFLSSLAAVKSIVELYPRNKIIAKTSFDRKLLINLIESSDVTQVVGNPKDHYRRYNLNEYTNPEFSNALTETLMPYEAIVLLAVGLLDNALLPSIRERKWNRFKINLPRSNDKKYFVVLMRGDKIKTTYKGMGDLLEKELGETIDIGKDGKYDIIYLDRAYVDKLGSDIELLNNATGVICCGENELSYLSSYLGVPTFVYLPKDTHHTIANQYSIFENTLFTYISSDLEGKENYWLEYFRDDWLPKAVKVERKVQATIEQPSDSEPLEPPSDLPSDSEPLEPPSDPPSDSEPLEPPSDDDRADSSRKAAKGKNR